MLKRRLRGLPKSILIFVIDMLYAPLNVGKEDMFENRYPKEVVLKDGQEVILRLLKPTDEKELHRFYSKLSSSDQWFLKEDSTDIAVIRKWIANHESGRALCVLATHRQHIAAHASLLRRPYGSRLHIGRLQVMVAQDFRFKQLGTWMVFDLIRRAMELGLDKVRADFVVGIENPAIEAARKLDFIQEGRLKDYIQDENGNSHDYQIMVKHLHKEWSDY